MIYYIIGFVFSMVWIAYEIYTAPEMDDNGRITKPGKSLKDLFKKK